MLARHSNYHAATKLAALGYNIIPLIKGTKKPLIKWKNFKYERINSTIIENVFKRTNADIGIITGESSGIICLDFDKPPYLPDGYRYTETPSGGRHYWFKYQSSDEHRLAVRDGLDIPWVVKLYAPPVINEGCIKDHVTLPTKIITQTTAEKYVGPRNNIQMKHIDHCYFIQWFKERRHTPWENRYALARAYVSNVIQTTDADLYLGPDYRHTEQIISNIQKPHYCETIHSMQPCPFFNATTSSCMKRANVFSPLGLAMKYEKSDRDRTLQTTTAHTERIL